MSDQEHYLDEIEEEAPRKKKRFRLFDSQREGPGVEKDEEPITPDLRGFFRSFKRNFTKLVRVNLFTLIGNFPVLFALLGISGLFKVEYMTAVSGYFADLRTQLLLGAETSPATMAVVGALGAQIPNSAMTTASYVFLGLSLLTFITFGFVKVGTTYILRSLVRGEPAFMMTDFRYAVKRNRKQGFIFGIIDLFLLLLVPLNMVTLLQSTGTFLNSVFFWANVAIAFFYLLMRPYVYLQMITFDLKLTKIVKNSLLFSLLGFKRNLLALLGVAILYLLTFIFIFGLGGALLPLGVAMFFVIFAAGSYMHAFAAWHKIETIMVAPAEESEDYSTSEAEAE
ncbi:MAG: hypothetical protein IJF73_00880 [Clostridia bacterium]|nr:hypothetical protein [Clostridia bacterium]